MTCTAFIFSVISASHLILPLIASPSEVFKSDFLATKKVHPGFTSKWWGFPKNSPSQDWSTWTGRLGTLGLRLGELGPRLGELGLILGAPLMPALMVLQLSWRRKKSLPTFSYWGQAWPASLQLREAIKVQRKANLFSVHFWKISYLSSFF